MKKQAVSKLRSTSENSEYRGLGRLFRRQKSATDIATKAGHKASKFIKLPVELLLQVAKYADQESLLRLILTCRLVYWQLTNIYDWKQRYAIDYPISNRRELTWLRQHARRLMTPGSSKQPLKTSAEWFSAYCRRRTTEENMLHNRCVEYSFSLPTALSVGGKGLRSVGKSSYSVRKGNDSVWTVMAADARRTVFYQRISHRIFVVRADIPNSDHSDAQSQSLMAKRRCWELKWPIEPQLVNIMAMDDTFLVAECRSRYKKTSFLCIWSHRGSFVVSNPNTSINLVVVHGCWLLAQLPDMNGSIYGWSRFQVYNLITRRWCSGAIVLRQYQRPCLLDIDEQTAYVHVCFTRGSDTAVQWQLWEFSVYHPARCINTGEFPRPLLEMQTLETDSYSDSEELRRPESITEGIRYCYSESYDTNSIIYDIAIYAVKSYHIIALQHISRVPRDNKESVRWQLCVPGHVDLVGTLKSSKLLLLHCREHFKLLSMQDGSLVYSYALSHANYTAPVLGNACALFYQSGNPHQLYNAMTSKKCLPWTTEDGGQIALYGWRQLSVTHLVAKRGIQPVILDYLPIDKQGHCLSTNLYPYAHKQSNDIANLLPLRVKDYITTFTAWKNSAITDNKNRK
ncbi:hypothetical protein BDF19DRAFT_451443 [Syncephalis fuscata]|nr:hypothetical protein BDF19DRAFT_451443 [Syncephalis fuscata]